MKENLKKEKYRYVLWILSILCGALVVFPIYSFWKSERFQKQTIRIPTSINKVSYLQSALNTTRHERNSLNTLKLENTKWEREKAFDAESTVIVSWNVSQGDLVMLVIAKTTGAIAIGFTYKTIFEADFLIGWIHDNKVFVQDYHIDADGSLTIDDQQDYDPVTGEKNITHTIFIFRRKLSISDKFNIQIKGSIVNIYWHLFEDFQMISQPRYKINWNNSILTTLLDLKFEKPDMKTHKTYDILLGNLTMKSHSTTVHRCRLVRIPNFRRQLQIIGYESVIDPRSVGLIHHMLLMRCDFEIPVKEGGTVCHGLVGLYIFSHCGVWLAGATESTKSMFYPPHIGEDFGSKEGKPSYFYMEIHFNFPRKHFILQDNSGFRLYYTEKLRQHNAGIFKVGIEGLQLIPPKQKEFSNIGLCSSKCSQRFFPSGGIHIVSYFFHAHHRAKKLKLHQFRNGKELATIIEDNFSFEFQKVRFLRNEIHVLPNDTLAIECIYDSTKDDSMSVYGFDTSDEMCEVFLQTYPATDMFKCISGLDTKSLREIIHYIPDFLKGNVFSDRTLQLIRLFGADFSARFMDPNLFDPIKLQQLYYYGSQDALCQHKNGNVVHESKLEDFVKYEDKPIF